MSESTDWQCSEDDDHDDYEGDDNDEHNLEEPASLPELRRRQEGVGIWRMGKGSLPNR